MIQIQHLTKRFAAAGATVVALNDINLEIQDGDIYGIIGMSGAGKSTLVRCINMLERPDEGKVIVNGREMMQLSPAELRDARREITMIFQQFNLLMQRTCLKNICFPMELAGVPKDKATARARELLELVGLPDKADAYPAQLSGGQKQRIAIARALATNPKVLLCDEATSALDPNTTHAILQLIQKINREMGITVVIITHQMSVVEDVCSHVAILDNGTVVEQGSVRDIFSNPHSDAAKRLVFPAGTPERELLPGRKMVPFYANVTTTPAYLSNTTGAVSTNNFYWNSRMIAAMADAAYSKSVFHIERYQLAAASAGHANINTYDAKLRREQDASARAALREQANEAMADTIRGLAADTLDKVLYELSCQMKNCYSRSDA